MLVPSGVAAVLGLLLLVYCLLNVATTPEDQVRTLPKPVWLLLVILLPFVGSLGWLLAGRPQRASGPAGVGAPRTTRSRPARSQPAAASSPDDDEAFLRSLRQRAEEQRRRAVEEERRRAAEGEDPPA